MHPSLVQFFQVIPNMVRKSSRVIVAAASRRPSSRWDRQYAVSSIVCPEMNQPRSRHGRCLGCWGRVSPKSPGYLRMSHLPASYWTGLSDLLRGRFDAVRHVRSIKTPLDQTHVYSIESEDRLATFAVTRFLYRTIGDGRNTGVLGVLILTMSSELYNKKKFITIRIHIVIWIMFYPIVKGWNNMFWVSGLFKYDQNNFSDIAYLQLFQSSGKIFF